MEAVSEEERNSLLGPTAKMNGAAVFVRSRFPSPDNQDVQFLHTASARSLPSAPMVLLPLIPDGQICCRSTSLAYEGSECRVAMRGLTVTPVPFSLAYAAKIRESFISDPMPTAAQACPAGASRWK